MKKIILLVVVLVNLTSLNSQWIITQSYQHVHFTCIQFINKDTGWVTTLLEILKSTNGGINWIVQAYYPTGIYPRWFHFIDENYGWVVCQDGNHIRTSNGGVNWVTGNYPGSTNFCGVYFVNHLTGWATGYESVVKTTNGGVSWFPQVFNYYCNYPSVYFVNAYTGWVACCNGNVLKTTNSGINWVMQTTGSNKQLVSIFFISENVGWVGGYDGILFKTTNSGTNWIVQNTGSTHSLYCVRFINNETGWAVGNYARIIKTINGGGTWHQQYIGTYEDVLLSGNFFSENTGWTSGYRYILKTTNGGITGFENTGSVIPAHFSLSQNYPNPFNPVTRIKYQIPLSRGVSAGRGVLVKLIIYDILGREIETLVNETQKPGSYEVTWDGSGYASGVYFYKLMTDEFVETKKMVLIK